MSAVGKPWSNAREEELAARLEVEMQDYALLRKAMGHRSWCAENGAVESNERLEFLGDAVLGLVVTTHLYRTYPDFPEGELAKIRAAVVSTTSLAEVAHEFGVGAHLLLGKGEDLSGGREKRSILADAVEAVIGAVYLDGGWPVVEPLIMRLVGDRLAVAALGPGGHDFKTRLQEFAAHAFEHIPRYEIQDHGPDHEKRFVATVYIDGVARGVGEGPSKKEAEQAAAAIAWKQVGATLAPMKSVSGGVENASTEPGSDG
jgi:ribonuclease-3